MKKESIWERIFSVVTSILVLVALGFWTLKGLEYLTEKTRETKLNADYTEVMLKTYKD